MTLAFYDDDEELFLSLDAEDEEEFAPGYALSGAVDAGYVAEDGVTPYITEDNQQYYVQEQNPATLPGWVGFVPSYFNFVNGQNFAASGTAAGALAGYIYQFVNTTPGFTGPDGSAFTATKLTETTDTFRHFISTGGMNFKSLAGSEGTLFGVPLRDVLIAKAAERTRIVLKVLDTSVPGSDGQETGDLAAVHIDLSNGTVLDQSVTNFTIDAVTVTQPFGNSGFLAGWWMITMDWRRTGPNNTSFSYDTRVYLDNGTGTAASTPFYTGDGHSGVFLWYLSFLVKAAWNFTGESFRDDFTSLSTIDINDTRRVGYNWYVHNNWPATSQIGACWQIASPTPTSFFSQRGTIVTIAGNAPNGCGMGITSVAANPSDPTKFINGFTWGPPAIVECSFAFDPTIPGDTHNNGGGGGCFHITPTIGTQNPLTNSTEIDMDDSCINFGGGLYLCNFLINTTDQGFVADATSGAYGHSITDFRNFAVMIFNPSSTTNNKGFAFSFEKNPNDNRSINSLVSGQGQCTSKPWTSSNLIAQGVPFMTICTAGEVHMLPGGGAGDILIPTNFDWFRVIT